MAITRTDFDHVCEADLEELVQNQVPEGMQLDYKGALYGASDNDKKEFVKDASSFANTASGHIIIGLTADGGMPTAVLGVDKDLDAAMLRYESLLRDRLEPRLIGVRMLPVPLNNGRRALVIRIPKSWNPPHAVIQNKSRLIFARNSAGVHEASVDEMRAMFTAGATLLQRAREFHRRRMTDIHGGDTPFPLAGDQGRMVLHIIPFSAFATELLLDPRRMQGQPLTPIWCTGMNYGYNVDGYLTTSGGGDRIGYVQVFRNGIIEAAAGDVRARVERGWILYAEEVEDHICTKMESYMSALAQANVPAPMLVMLGGVRMHDTIMIGKPLAYREQQILRKTDLLLPTVTIDHYGQLEDYRRALKPIFDALWNAAGYGASESYAPDGSWRRTT